MNLFFSSLMENIDVSPNNKQRSLDVISIQYNDQDYSYMAEYGDNNVISVTSVVPDITGGQMDANTGLSYDKKNNHLIVVSVRGDELIYSRDIVLKSSINDIAGQGLSYDSITNRFFVLGTEDIKIYNSSSELIGSLIFPSTQPSPGMIYFSEYQNLFFCSYDSFNFVKVWKPFFNENRVELYQDIPILDCHEGVSLNEREGSIWVNRTNKKTKIDFFGNVLYDFPCNPSGSGTVNEGLAVDPTDNTLWYNSDQYYHGGVIGGNRLWHIDPEQTFNKRINIPDQIQWEWGTFINCKLQGRVIVPIDESVESKWISPIFDFETYNMQKSIHNFSLSPSRIITSETQPSAILNPEFPIKFYKEWGTTVPVETAIEDSLRYAQFEFTF